jgi:hypothetical protein
VKHAPPDRILLDVVRMDKELAERADKLKETISSK